MRRAWGIEADRDRCMGTGACAFAAPEVFEVDSTGKVMVIGPVEPEDKRIRNAVADCPMEALRLIEGSDA